MEQRILKIRKIGLIQSLIFSITLVLISSFDIFSQNTYTLNLSDNSTYSTGCGKITASSWTVKNDSCVLYTPFFRKETTGCSTVSYNFRINQSGNGDADDIAYIQYKLNNNPWETDTLITANNYSSVHNLLGYFTLCYSDFIQLRVIMKTNSKSEFWSIKDGDITLSGNFSTYDFNPGPISNLPVEMAFFTGSIIDEKPLLKWATYSEINSDYFLIERSTDGKVYEAIATVDGSGNSNSLIEYSFNDMEITASGNYYYKLKQVDFDGEYTYYGPVFLSIKTADLNFNIFPNPAAIQGSIVVSIPSISEENFKLFVYNSMGAIVHKDESYSNSDNFVLAEKGFYTVKIVSESGELFSKKLIVQ